MILHYYPLSSVFPLLLKFCTLKALPQGLLLEESKLRQNQIISQPTRLSLANPNKGNQPCGYNLGQNQVHRAAFDEASVINGGKKNCSYTHHSVLSFRIFSTCIAYLIRAPLGIKAQKSSTMKIQMTECTEVEDHGYPTIVIIIGHAHLLTSFAFSFISLPFKMLVNY